MEDIAQVYGIDVPRSKCEECGLWFTAVSGDDEPICPYCLEGMADDAPGVW